MPDHNLPIGFVSTREVHQRTGIPERTIRHHLAKNDLSVVVGHNHMVHWPTYGPFLGNDTGELADGERYVRSFQPTD